MKNLTLEFTLFFIFSMFTLKGFSQNLTFADLKYLIEHDVESADNYITSKGFKYHEAQKGENGDCDAMIWSFDRDAINDRATSFIAKNCYQANFGFIWYQLGSKPTFDKIKNYCKTIGLKLTKTETSPFNDLCTTYENNIYKIEFCSGLNTGTNKNSYTISLRLK
jgi:hypothetical protein